MGILDQNYFGSIEKKYLAQAKIKYLHKIS